MAETETKARWRNVRAGLYYETPGVYGADKIATFGNADAARHHAEYLNALEACAEALEAVTKIADWYAGDHEFGTEDSAPINRAQEAIARLRELRG